MTHFTFISRLPFTRSLLVGVSLLASLIAWSPVYAEHHSEKQVATPIQASAQSLEQKVPEQVVKETIDAVVANIQENRDIYKEDITALYKMLDETLVPALHIPRMSKLVLGKKVWGTSTDVQKADFAEQFKTLLMKSYAAALLQFTGDQKVVYEDVKYKPSGDIAVVKGVLITADGEKFGIVLNMSNRDDTQWRAYNMEAGDINVISTYRLALRPILDKKGLDGLIADLREKNS